jgi:predicted permease
MFAWVRRLRARIRYRSFDADLRQEIETHRAMAEHDLQASGIAAPEARAAASRSLGNVTLAREQARGVWYPIWLESVWQDIRFGVRSLRRSPVFTATALLTMSIGIGLNTGMFTAFNAIALRGWPVEHADSLVLVRMEPSGQPGTRARSGFSLDALEDFQRRSQTLAVVAAKFRAFEYVALSPTARSQHAYGQFVTPGFFDATGVWMQLGRNFRPDEDANGAGAQVVIISHALWQGLFAGRPDVIGQPLYVGMTSTNTGGGGSSGAGMERAARKAPFVVIGVTREGWRGEQPYRDDIWLPLQTMRLLRPDYVLFSQASEQCCVVVLGRMAPGASHARVANELTLLLRQRDHGNDAGGRRVHVSDTSFYGQTSGPLRLAVPLLILAITAVVLLLTGANIAHLQLARTIARAREIRTRLALGAGRRRVARQLVTESLLLSVVAGAGALAIVYAVIDPLMHLAEMPVRDIWAPNATVFVYCAGVSLLMSIAFSLLPALRSTRVSLAHGAGLSATPSGRMRFNLVLLTTQIALSTSLLTGASLLSRAIQHATTADIGFPIDGLTIAVVAPSGTTEELRANAGARQQALELALASSSLPRAAFMSTLPLSSYQAILVRRPEDAPQSLTSIDLFPMSASAFDVLGVALVEGRPHTDRIDSTENEAVVSQRAARMLWPGESALGKTLINAKVTYRVVGVSKDAHFISRESIRPTMHIAVKPGPFPPVTVIRAGGAGVIDQLKAVIKSVDPGASVVARSLSEQLAAEMRDSQMGAQAAWAGSILALALSTFGVFGVFAHVVESRRREIGIRLALGAGKAQILRALFRTTRLAMLAGLSAGLLLSLGTGPMLEQFLFGLSPFDPIAFGVVAVILGVAALVATFIPARRALSVDPATTLRADG